MMGLSMSGRKAVTKTIATRYARADKTAKGVILDELCATTGRHRNHARKALTQALHPTTVRRRTPRPPKYGSDVIAALRFCWAVLGAPAGKRPAPVLPSWCRRSATSGIWTGVHRGEASGPRRSSRSRARVCIAEYVPWDAASSTTTRYQVRDSDDVSRHSGCPQCLHPHDPQDQPRASAVCSSDSRASPPEPLVASSP